MALSPGEGAHRHQATGSHDHRLLAQAGLGPNPRQARSPRPSCPCHRTASPLKGTSKGGSVQAAAESTVAEVSVTSPVETLSSSPVLGQSEPSSDTHSTKQDTPAIHAHLCTHTTHAPVCTHTRYPHACLYTLTSPTGLSIHTVKLTPTKSQWIRTSLTKVLR